MDHINNDCADDRPANLQRLAPAQHVAKTAAQRVPTMRIICSAPAGADALFASAGAAAAHYGVSRGWVRRALALPGPVAAGPLAGLLVLRADLPGERWRAGVFRGAAVHASSLGRIRHHGGAVTRGFAKNGHLHVGVTVPRAGAASPSNRGQLVTVPVHTLVATVWEGPAPSRKYIAVHADGDRLNNRADNVCWATRATIALLGPA